ncbi:MAG: malonyl-[acyl-carrier protein] O-methyltransferase BioC [Gammaproteobacteria bacterium]|nr:MAG: malonyl-[acyl-carrier protein] O-methyltransferase BioC [Gammaproteobacteria bacterium]
MREVKNELSSNESVVDKFVVGQGNYKLSEYHYPCKSKTPLVENIALLHGWGTNSDSWSTLIPALEKIAKVIALDLPGFGKSDCIPDFNLDEVLHLIAQQLPEKCVLIGWSLGGVLAVQLAARYPEKISRLVTLATNAKFVATGDYQTAMLPSVNAQFNQGFERDTAATLKLFSGLLAQGDLNERVLLKKVRSLITPGAVNKNWLQALHLLTETDNRHALAQLKQEGLHLLAAQDALVPASAYEPMLALNPKQNLKIIADAGHAIHWSNPELVSNLIVDFLLDLPTSLDKKQVAYSFSRAAKTYDSVANLQRYVGNLLLGIADKNANAEIVLDLGCGTGYFTPKLQEMYPESFIVGVDIAEGMLRVAGENHRNQQNWLCADADFLPLASDLVDIIFSNFALQWCTDLPHLFKEIKRILKPGGKCVFTSLGPATLHELKTAWSKVDSHVHVNQFHESQQLLGYLEQAGFQIIHFENKIEVMKFENLSDLTRSLKYLGAHNINAGRGTGLTGRKRIQAFKQAYEEFRNHELLPATYDILYLKVKK